MLRVVNLWKKLNWHTYEDQSPGWRDRHEAVREKQGVDSRDEVRHSEKNNTKKNSLFFSVPFE